MAVAPSRLLLVDDNADNRNVLSRRLERQGYAVVAAESGEVALQSLNHHPCCDLVLLDIMMRDMDGLETLKRIRRRYSMLQLPVIMVTALSESQNAVEALQLGANDYITKPVDFLVALARVRTHLVLKRLAEQNDDLVQIVGQDMQRALGQIRDSASQLLEGFRAGPEQGVDGLQERAAFIGHLAEQTHSRMREFLEQKAPEAGRLQEHADLNDVVRAVVSRNLDYARRKGIELVVQLDEALSVVGMFQSRLEQVVENLVENAIKFSPSGTTTRIITRQDAGWALVEVADEGPGIRAQDLGKLFDRYTHPPNQPTGGEAGAGVGLALCKELVEECHGEIGVRNNESRGATFWCRLPIG